MTELELYKRMYAGIVGTVDNVLQEIGGMLMENRCDRKAVMKIGQELKKALLDTEDLYLDMDGEPSQGRVSAPARPSGRDRAWPLQKILYPPVDRVVLICV